MTKRSKYTYRNKTGVDLTVMNVGVVKANGTISSVQPIYNPNLVLVEDEQVEEKAKPVKKTKGKE